MNNCFNLAVNTSIYDGYDLDTILSSIKKCGFEFFELAYNKGYVGNLDEYLFSKENAEYINNLKDKYKLSTLALGCTMDLSSDDFLQKFSPRIIFSRLIGTKYINVCTSSKKDKKKMLSNLKEIRPILEDNECILCLENGGDYNFDAFITIEDGIELLDQLGNNVYSINFDPGNMATYDKSLNIENQAIKSIEYAKHFHIKNVKITGDKFIFQAINKDGLIDYKNIIKKLKMKNIPCSLEIPLRIYRELDSTARRLEERINLSIIESVLSSSKKYIEKEILG